MEQATKNIEVNTSINFPVEKVWQYWTDPKSIVKWNFASDDWQTTFAENDLQVNGKFNYRMEAKDGSFGFDFWGNYDQIVPFKLLEFTLGDNRKVKVSFISLENKTEVIETFEVENENPIEMQQIGWQSILNNFKKYVESKK